jgi:mannose/fructose/N-acetylgalactosamine-specific phosphotransferase system component IID
MRLSFPRFLKIFFASFFIQTSWSFFSMQGMGFLFNLFAGADKDQRNKILETHKGFFNTHPYMSSYIIGATLRAHDEGNVSPDEIRNFVAITQTSFASTGDLLFWQTLRPAMLLIAAILAVKSGVIGPIMFVAAFNIFHLFHRIRGIYDGYHMGRDVIYLLKAKRFIMVRQIFEILGAFSAGLLFSIASLKIDYLLILPIITLFILLLIKRFSSVLIILAVLLLIIIMVMV